LYKQVPNTDRMMINARPSFLSFAVLITSAAVNGFTFVPSKSRCAASRSIVSLNMGLFDGMKEAFSAPAVERSVLDSSRETPIDRWMGWNSRPNEEAVQQDEGTKAPKNFIDSMDKVNYVSVELNKPMGIVFEENGEDTGGIFILSLKEDGNADKTGALKAGDQLVAVGAQKVVGLSFDDALGAIVDCDATPTKLTVFRGGASMLYGPTGASQDWLDEFVAS